MNYKYFTIEEVCCIREYYKKVLEKLLNWLGEMLALFLGK